MGWELRSLRSVWVVGWVVVFPDLLNRNTEHDFPFYNITSDYMKYLNLEEVLRIISAIRI